MSELFWPFSPEIINYGFGNPPGYGGFHNGIDFPVPQGTVLRATAAGVIRNVDAGGAGAGVDLMTDDGWKVRSWHVSKFLQPQGARVNAGDDIAISGGQPGTWGAGNATGAHLHWGVAIDGRDNWVDPASLNPQEFGTHSTSFIGEDMKLVRTVEGISYLFREDGIVKIESQRDFDYLKQIIETPTSTYMLTSELMSVAKYVTPTPVKVTVDTKVISDAIKSALGNVNINVDALAQAIADKLNGATSMPDITTKAEILSAIEANYPGDK